MPLTQLCDAIARKKAMCYTPVLAEELPMQPCEACDWTHLSWLVKPVDGLHDCIAGIVQAEIGADMWPL